MIAEGQEDEHNMDDDANDGDLLGTDIFKKYIDTVGGPLFRAETELMKKHNKNCKLSNVNKKLCKERNKIALSGDLRIKKVKVDRVDYEKHNNYDNIPSHPYRALFTGRTNSGKTTNMVNLLIEPQYLKDYYDKIYIFSPNAHIELEYQKIKELNQGQVILKDKFDLTEFRKLFEKFRQNALNTKNDRTQMDRILLFIDDFASKNEVMKSEILSEVYFMCRKYSVSCWLAVQRYKKASADIRNNTEFHVMYEQSAGQAKIIAEELCVGSFTQKHMYKVMEMLSDEPYSFLFINCRKKVPEGRFRYGYHEILHPVKDGHFHNQEINQYDDDDEDEDDEDEDKDEHESQKEQSLYS